MTAGDQGWGNAPTPQHQAPYNPPAVAGPFIALKPLLLTFALFTFIHLGGGLVQQLATKFVLKNPSADNAIIVFIASFGWCGCSVLLDLLGGMSYAFLYKRSQPVNIGRGAAGGALSGAATRLISTLAVGALILFLYPELDPGTTSSVTDSGVEFRAGGFLGVAVTSCLWTFGGAALGAIGGLIGGLIWKPK